MEARWESIEALGERYRRSASREEKILDEFVGSSSWLAIIESTRFDY